MSASIGELIRAAAPAIISNWEALSHQQIGAAGSHSASVIKNMLPEYLEELAKALSESNQTAQEIRARGAAERMRLGKFHGSERALKTSYLINELIFEFHILREAIFRALEHDGYVVPAVDRNVIISSIEQAVNDSVTEFSKTLREIEERFVLTLAHDLRNPIGTAQASADLISQNPGNEKLAVQMSDIVVRSMKKADTMIQDLLDGSKLGAGGRFPLKYEECDLVEIAREAIQGQQAAAPQVKFQITSPKSVRGYWSCNGLSRMLENLISNAVKYGDQNWPIIVDLQQGELWTSLTVHNQGNPISESDQKKLFQKYQRAQTASRASGWGLGLMFVKGIVEAHQGAVEVSSHQDSGTDFIVRLPNDFRTLPELKFNPAQTPV